MSSSPQPQSLTLAEARERRALLSIAGYDVSLDLTGAETFTSSTRVTFTSRGGTTFLDLKPAELTAITHNGTALDPAMLDRGRFPIDAVAGDNEIVVDAVMAFRNDGEGLHLAVDPADGARYVYGMSFMDAAPSIFACFDQPDLKAPFTFHVTAPDDWQVFGNSPVANPEPGRWEFETSQPLSTYFVTLVAGPWHVVRDEHDGIPLSISCRQSIAEHLDADVPELFEITKQCFDEFHRIFGIRYPFGDYHQAFVPEFNAGAMENPGCITFRDPLVFTSKVTRGERIQRATTIAHEMAHQWFGNIVTPAWWDDLWLNESFAEYMGNRVAAAVTEYDDAWEQLAWTRRQWGLMADQGPSTHPVAGTGAADAAAALQDFDGISYAKGSSILKQLNARLGDEVFFAGVIDHLERNRFGNATMHDLFASWERAGAGDLSAFIEAWLRTSGPDSLSLERTTTTLRREPPTDDAPAREHQTSIARWRPGAEAWQFEPVRVSDVTESEIADDEAVVIDPHEETWAVTTLDATTLDLLPQALAATDDPAVRAAVWNGVRSGWHNAEVSPDAATRLAVATIATESVDYALRSVVLWLSGRLLPLHPEADQAAAALHEALDARTGSAAAGSGLQLAAFQGAVAMSASPEQLREWLAGATTPAGLVVDSDLRWRILVRLAVLGAIEAAELDEQLAAAPGIQATVDHARAMAARPTAAAKEWAWQRFLGAEPASNYQLEAIGLGMWSPSQRELTEPYVERYFEALPELPAHHAGWVLGDVVEVFFPRTALDEGVLQRAQRHADDPDLTRAVRRRLVDATDLLERSLRTVQRWSLSG